MSRELHVECEMRSRERDREERLRQDSGETPSWSKWLNKGREESDVRQRVFQIKGRGIVWRERERGREGICFLYICCGMLGRGVCCVVCGVCRV